MKIKIFGGVAFSIVLAPVSYIFLAFYRVYLSPGVRTSGTPGQVLKKIKTELMKSEHAGRNGGGRNGGGRARVF